MAKVHARGRATIGTLEYLTKSFRYMSDGVVLKNSGFGWKVRGRVKAGTDPRDAYARAADKLTAMCAANPAYAAYRSALHNLAGLNKRWKLHAAVALMPNDCDGVWSEACDGYADNISADVDQVAEVCRAYLAMVREVDERKRAQQPAAAAEG